MSASQRTPASIQSALELTVRVGNSGAENSLFAFVFQDPPRGGWQGCRLRLWPWRGKAGFQVARGCALADLCTHVRLGPWAAPPQKGRPCWPPVARILARGGWTVQPAKATGTFCVTARLPRTTLPEALPRLDVSVLHGQWGAQQGCRALSVKPRLPRTGLGQPGGRLAPTTSRRSQPGGVASVQPPPL